MSKIDITIGITGLNNTDNPGPGVPGIRGIKDSTVFNARIIGLAYENLEPGIYMDGLLDKTYMIPYPSDGTESFLERIEFIHSREKLDLIIPNFDAELFTFMKASKRLEELGIKTFLPSLEQYEERSKSRLVEFGKKYNVKVPESIDILSHSDIQKFDKNKKLDSEASSE